MLDRRAARRRARLAPPVAHRVLMRRVAVLAPEQASRVALAGQSIEVRAHDVGETVRQVDRPLTPVLRRRNVGLLVPGRCTWRETVSVRAAMSRSPTCRAAISPSRSPAKEHSATNARKSGCATATSPRTCTRAGSFIAALCSRRPLSAARGLRPPAGPRAAGAPLVPGALNETQTVGSFEDQIDPRPDAATADQKEKSVPQSRSPVA